MKSTLEPLSVLVVEENPDIRHLIREKIKRRFSATIEETASIREASSKARGRQFDVVIWGHGDWEEGAQLYCELLNEQKPPPKFIMFMSDPDILKPDFDGYFPVLKKDDYDGLVDEIDWLVFQTGDE